MPYDHEYYIHDLKIIDEKKVLAEAVRYERCRVHYHQYLRSCGDGCVTLKFGEVVEDE